MTLEPSRGGLALSHKSGATIPASSDLRMLKDWLAIEPLDYLMSARVFVAHETKPVRGIVRSVGPGCHPKRYDKPTKHERTKMWESPAFRPTTVQIGDEVELGGIEHRGYAFQTFYWGDRLHLMCREEDIAGVVEA